MATSLWGRVTEAWSGAVTAFRGETVAEHGGGMGSIDPDDWQYQNLTGNPDPNSGQLENEVQRTRMRRMARLLFAKSAIGGALPEQLVARVWGEGFQVKANDPDVEETCKRFVEDPANNLMENGERFARELLVFGELCLPIAITPENADVRLGYLLPEQIEAVVWAEGDAKTPLAVIQRRGNLGDNRWLWVIPQPDPAHDNRFAPHPGIDTLPDPGSEGSPRWVVSGRDGVPVALPHNPVTGVILPEIVAALNSGVGKVEVAGYAFYHRFGGLATGRGRSIYERVADWLKGADDFLFGTLRNAILQGYLLIHVTCKGLNEGQLRKRQAQLRRLPPPGAILVTNDGETWEMKSPAAGMATTIKEIFSSALRVIGLGSGLPAHEIGADDDVNRSTAKEAKSVSLNRAKLFQRFLGQMFTMWMSYQVDQKVHKGQLEEAKTDPDPEKGKTKLDRKVEVTLPALDARDEAEQATSVKSAVDAMTTAVSEELVLRKDARAFVYRVMGQDLPSEDDFTEELAKQRKEDEEKFGEGGPLADLMGRINTGGGFPGQPGRPAAPSANGSSGGGAPRSAVRVPAAGK